MSLTKETPTLEVKPKVRYICPVCDKDDFASPEEAIKCRDSHVVPEEAVKLRYGERQTIPNTITIKFKDGFERNYEAIYGSEEAHANYLKNAKKPAE